MVETKKKSTSKSPEESKLIREGGAQQQEDQLLDDPIEMDFVAQVERIEAADAIPAFLKGVFITGKSKYQIEDRLADCVKTHNRAFLFHA